MARRTSQPVALPFSLLLLRVSGRRRADANEIRRSYKSAEWKRLSYAHWRSRSPLKTPSIAGVMIEPRAQKPNIHYSGKD